MLKNQKTRKPKHFCVDSRKIRKSYTSNETKVWYVYFLAAVKKAWLSLKGNVL